MTKELKDMSNLQIKVFMMIPRGTHNLVSTKEIGEVLDIDERTTMDIVLTLIMKYGIPIGSLRQSDKFGYFIATNEEEKRIGIYSLEQQITTMRARAKAVRDADLELATLYKRKYKDEAVKRDYQSSIYEYLNMEENKQMFA